MIEVPYLTEAQIEARSDAALEEFARDREAILAPPVPVEDKLLYHLGLRLHMDDLHTRFCVPRTAGRVDILAALWIEDREIRIDESLDPEVNPDMEGRYRFSIGHEIGHWELHKRYIVAASAEPVLLMKAQSPIVCRNEDLQVRQRPKHDIRERMELQANKFSACLLMPRSLIFAAWQRRFKKLDPVVVEDSRRVAPELQLPSTSAAQARSATPIAHRILEELISDFARQFRTSRHAMRIRLRNLALLWQIFAWRDAAWDSRISFSVIHGWSACGGADHAERED
jgi:Zn-dependent peptidase ImmA (M78 family)